MVSSAGPARLGCTLSRAGSAELLSADQQATRTPVADPDSGERAPDTRQAGDRGASGT